MNLAQSYALAARTTRREAGNFYVAFLTLPRAERRAVYALYSFFRELDSAADAPDLSVARKRESILGMRRRLAAAVASATACGRSPTEKLGEAGLHTRSEDACERDLALADAIERFAIEPSDIEDVISGVEVDLEPVEMQTMDDLERYAYLVASAVGLATLAVLNRGVPPTDEMRGQAVRLGLGMQLVNVVRDIGEDAAQGRIYVPRDVLDAHGATRSEIERGDVSEPLRQALAEVAERAREHLRAGRELMANVPRSSRACLWLLAEVYGRILTQIEESGYDVFSSRISLPRREKLWLLATARWRA